MRVHVHAMLMLAAIAAAAARAAPPAALAEDHPILGTWEFDFPDRNCTETYRFFPTGTTLDSSGEEVTESAFEISAKADARHFYKLTSKITKGNGKKDCDGQVSKLGVSSINYIMFHGSGESLIMCKSPTLEACFGPLLKAHGRPV